MFSGLTIWYQISGWCAFTWGILLLLLSAYLHLPVVLCVRLRPRGRSRATSAHLLLFLISSSLEVVLVRLYRCSSWHSWTMQPHSKLPDPLTLTIFLLPLLKCSLSLTYRNCFVDVFVGTGIHNSAFWLPVVFCNGLGLVQREVCLIRCENSKCLECS